QPSGTSRLALRARTDRSLAASSAPASPRSSPDSPRAEGEGLALQPPVEGARGFQPSGTSRLAFRARTDRSLAASGAPASPRSAPDSQRAEGKGSHANRPSREREAFSRAEPAGSRSERGPIARLPPLALLRVPEARRIPSERRGKGSHSNRPSKEREAFSRAEPAGSRSERGPNRPLVISGKR